MFCSWFFIGLFIYISCFNKKILVLLSLEFMFLSIFMFNIFFSMNSFNSSSFYSSMIFLSFLVLDSVLGLCVLVGSTRHSSMMSNFFFSI